MAKDTQNFDWLSHLTDCLKSTKYCSLATIDEKGVWSNPVYFAWDEKLNFYFISQMKSRHMKNIGNNPRVSLSIYATEQKDFLHGLQVEGAAKILLENKDEIDQAYKIYFGRSGKLNKDYYLNGKWTIVRIVPENIYYFNDKIFEEERQLVPNEFYPNKRLHSIK